VDPSKDSVTKHLKTGEDDKVLNILLGYGVGNHPDSAQQPVRYDWAMPFTTTDWADGGPNEIWFIITPEDEAVLTDVMYDAIYRSLDNWFPGVDVIEKSSYSSIPNNTVLVLNDDFASAVVSNYDENSQYIAKGKIYVPYDTELSSQAMEFCEEETSTLKDGAAEPQGLGYNTVYSGAVTEKTPADQAVFEIKYNKNPVVAWSVAYRGDPWSADDASDDLYYRANALDINGKIGYVKPIRRDF
jgi:hypothetical protein